MLLCAGLMVVLGIPAQASVIDASRSGTVELHFTQPNPHDDEPGPPASGISVDARRVADLDITTHQGQARAAGMNIHDITALPAGAFDIHRQTTSGPDGDAYFTQLPLGLYLLSPGEGSPDAFEIFALTVPRTDSSGRGWLYDVTAHPKAAGGEIPGDRDPAAPDEGAEEGVGDGEDIADVASTPNPQPDDGAKAPGTDSPASDDEGQLAVTGAGVLGTVLFGLVLITLGVVLLKRRKQ